MTPALKTAALKMAGKSPDCLWITGMNRFGGLSSRDKTHPLRLPFREEIPA
ncbi:MAG: hypothetical protein JWP04_1204 [Belnapia sp.]|jgi:hypothetical protein|nr:hypothetical protein [Belnapia sp.]